ncbi:hypothetical protein LR48_Vigan09g047100 [Vigna angularis]|uniref:Uncharacterized protein n=1 Tax=Phaseolus angularis TaxID=3914 RepID=A0A0L9VA53_PHAAN|nr:hypothetical protein LR48_Vigan09g047100 [Vigna angularis]
MTGQGSERPDKGKGVARPTKRQRQTPKYVLRVPARLPTIAAGSTSSVGPPPTPIIQPPTPAADPSPPLAAQPSTTPAVDPSPPPAAHTSTTPTAHPIPPPLIATPTPPPIVITPTPLPDPTSIPSSSSVSPFETATPPADPDSSGDGDGLDPSLGDRPWIEPYGKGFIPSRVASQAITRSIKQQFLSPWPTWGAIPQTERLKGVAPCILEDFSTRLSQVRSEHESAPTPEDASNADDDIRRTQCWIDIVGGKKKGRVYGAGQLAANYTASRGGTLKHQPSSSTSTPDEVLRLRQELHQRDQEITDLRTEFTNFKALVMRVLPETSQEVQNIPPTQPRASSSPAATQLPTSVQPSSVQPTPVQPSIKEQDDENHSDDSYVHY